MADDEDKVIRLADLKHTFDQKRQSKPDELPDVNSTKGALEWADRYYAVALIVGKFMIINKRIPGETILMSKKDFIDSLENIRLRVVGEDGVTKIVPLSKLWLEWTNRRTYERGVVFDPNNKFDWSTMRTGAYNKWEGFATEGVKGECPLMLDFIKNVICSGDEKHCHYATSWISQIFQEPGNKMGTSMVLQGLKGIGKSFLSKILGMLMDGKPGMERRQRLFLTVDNRNSIFGPHNDHLENIIGLCWEEAMWAGDKSHESSFKNIISGATLFVNPKNLPGRSVPNYIRSIVLSNSDWVVPASPDERRYFVMNVKSDHKDDKPYFDALEDELLNKGGLEALMYYFMHYDYSDVNLRTAMVTEAQIDQKTQTMFGVEKWWFNLLVSGHLPFIHNDERGYLVIKDKLFQNFKDSDRKRNDIYNAWNFGMHFVPLVPDLLSGKYQYHDNGKIKSMVGGKDKYTSGTERHNVYIIPKLSICRELMNFRLKSKYFDVKDDEEWEFPTFSERSIFPHTNLF